ncbi:MULTISPECIES: lipopolysaccharide kinase InaA family protein [Pseudomonas]|uniref:InaA protein n=2 Tax=Pseudomonas TaxID=286 RepID=A0AAX0VY99_9PSED|nr:MULTISPECIES: lipopolysaccharide kinase InaA family protein [Pseudomonas]MBH3357809.1 InaA protein [Pseudomonas guariconensis]MCO7621759.1 InaA protein [Pseudomonas guariconensis]MDM9595687.1 lipopolysaccharide kinase InaA family protein [Pseudomonas guariconensis]MDM9608517.1 lipopolysaccharide kinase InaA family protein [Pseudomonas guariconensis]MDM9613474.1 lipopolysaccharide kinase InaA family protein [Pseudomonas guariconensis]
MAVAGNAMSDFEYYWQQQGEWVEEPNQRRGGESGVQRLSDAKGKVLYAKRQVGHIYRSLRHPFGRPTVLRELDALNSFEQLGVRVPRLVFAGAERGADHQWRALLVSEALDGFVDLDTWHAEGARERYPQVLHERMLKELADNLARMHLGHWQHGCLYGKHVFVKVIGEGEKARAEVALLDLEKCRRRISCQRAAAKDLRQLRRHSSLNDAQWQSLLYFYQMAFGSAVKGLEQ